MDNRVCSVLVLIIWKKNNNLFFGDFSYINFLKSLEFLFFTFFYFIFRHTFWYICMARRVTNSLNLSNYIFFVGICDYFEMDLVLYINQKFRQIFTVLYWMETKNPRRSVKNSSNKNHILDKFSYPSQSKHDWISFKKTENDEVFFDFKIIQKFHLP